MKRKCTNENILFLLNDNRNCRSPNLQKYFSKGDNWIWRNKVIRCEGELYFAYLDDMPNWWTGVKVREVACYGAKSVGGEYVNLRGKPIEDVTDWFWLMYKERGKVSIPEIWRISIPKQLSHSEYHTI